MSSYINFYIKNKEEYIPIGTFSRNSMIYVIGSEVCPYEKGIPCSPSIINSCISDIASDINNTKEVIKEDEEMCNAILTMNNSVSEKIDAIGQYRCSIDENKEYLEELVSAHSYFTTLLNIIHAIEYNSNYDPEKYIWCGIEWYPDSEQQEN